VAKKKTARKSAKKGKKLVSRRDARKSSAKGRSARTQKKSARKGAARAAGASKKTAAKKKTGTRRSLPSKSTRKGGVSSAPMPGGEIYGEGNWKADEEYREGLKEFSETHDAEQLAREAAEEAEAEGPHPELEEEEDSEW